MNRTNPAPPVQPRQMPRRPAPQQRFQPSPASVRRLDTIAAAIGARRYLEIGVAHGHTFLAVDVPEKDAVDPHFLFSPDDHANAQTRFHAMPSDQFFAGCSLDRQFDLVFIDGLHLFEQAYRDLCNVLPHLHRGSVVLLDDTLPSDHFSAWRDGAAGVAARQATGSNDSSWHGDVFKVVFAIHDFHPGLNYVTIGTGGNPQTLIWQSRRFRRDPVLNSFTAIEALDYDALQERLGILRIMPEEQALAACLADLAEAGGVSPAF